MKTAAIVESVYVDPSALLKLYLKEPESRPMTAWASRHRLPLLITHHGKVELVNAIGLALYRGIIATHTHRAALAAVDDDFSRGRYVPANLLWRATLNRAADISREHTPSLGCRSLDVLHVASALELGMRHFLTFDARQKLLAKAVNLTAIVPA